MAKKRSKRYEDAAKLVESGKLYPLQEAAELIKKFPSPKFDESVTITFRLGIDPRQTDQRIKGTCPLPHGSGKTVRILVFADGEAATEAKNAGADHVGMDQLIKEVQGGFNDFDVVIATPAAMSEVRKLGRQLGPRGLMPNPKTGTVSDDVAEAVKKKKAGEVNFKTDKNGNVSVPVGKTSFDSEQLVENASAVINEVAAARPASAKGIFLESGTLAATMSPGIGIDISAWR